MTHLIPALTLVALLQDAPEAPQAPAPFPPSTALEQGLSPDELAALDALVRSFVEKDEIVGAELHVIAKGHTVLHEGYGWRDREAQVPMAPGGVFCVRSMTKPLIGTATWMLIEDRELALDDRVATYLPAFDADGLRDVTIEYLLRHESGLPMSLILDEHPRALESVRAVADLARPSDLQFAPGTSFRYSDQGTDTLTAVIEVVTGAPAEDFVHARVLEPLGMTSSACVLAADDPLRARTCSAYHGSPGAWRRYYRPDEPPLFPIFLGSQSLYSTTEDYARFLDLYVRRGRIAGQRLLRSSSVRRTLEPSPYPMGSATGFPGLEPEYGTLMQVWTRPAEGGGEREVVVLGHSGSDGTYAWAFPEQKVMVLYFTQSRGVLSGLAQTGLRVEQQLGSMLLGEPFDPLQAAPPLEPYLGTYWEGEGDLYRAIVRDGDGLALEILGKAVVPLDYVGDDRWRLRPQPTTVIAFDRDAAGDVSGYHIGEHQEFRFTPSPDLPRADEVAARVAAAHRLERLAASGPVVLHGRIDIPALDRHGRSTTWLAWPDRWRDDESAGEESGSVAYDGSILRRCKAGEAPVPLEGLEAELTAQRSPFLCFGDWRTSGVPFEVVQRLRHDDEDVILVRLGEPTRPAQTLYVDWNTGLVRRVDGMAFVEGAGRMGTRVKYDDFRDVGGALLPWRTDMELAHSLIGTIETVVEAVELGVETPAGFFALDR